MKRIFAFVILCLVFLLPSCSDLATGEKIIEGNIHTYYAMPDGTFRCEGYTYPYRVKVSGRMPGASSDSTFVYLSHEKEIPFDRAWRAAGLGSSTDDYFAREDAVLVELK